MIEFLRENRWGVAVLTLLFIVSRMWLDKVGIGPNAQVVLEHWQHADLGLLDQQYWKTLWFQHSQPPFWNGTIGLVVKLLGNDSAAVTGGLHLVFVLFSYIGTLLMLSIFQSMGLSRPGGLIAASVVSISPAVLFYENYIFYPHLTWFLVAIFLFGLQKTSRNGARWPIDVCFASLCVLSWSWAIFHPAFVLVAGAGALWIGHNLSQRKLVALLLLTTVISGLPIAKNSAQFGIPSSSSWFGINLAQTAVPFGSEQSIYCDFYLVHQTIWRENEPPQVSIFPSLTDTLKSSGHANMNHIAIAERAGECLGIARDAIQKRPVDWISDRFGQMISSHQTPSFAYFFDPDGWDQFDPEGFIETHIPAAGNLLLTLYTLLVFWCVYRSVAGPQRRLFSVILFFIVYFTLVSHLANGQEQQRMRYTISPLYWFLLVSILHKASQLFKIRFSAKQSGSGI